MREVLSLVTAPGDGGGGAGLAVLESAAFANDNDVCPPSVGEADVKASRDDNQADDGDSNGNVVAADNGNDSMSNSSSISDDLSSAGSDCESSGSGSSSCADDVTGGTAPPEAAAATEPALPALPAQPVKMLSSQPGYLELGEDRARELLSDRPIEELYEVEDQPFAR